MRKIFVAAVLSICALAVDAQVQPRPGCTLQLRSNDDANGQLL
jgi:hypothetical protein